jgi:hypothetical protein
VVTPCTGGVSRLALASLWGRFPLAAGRFQNCTSDAVGIGDGRCQSMATRSAYRIRASFGVSHPCIVRAIATAHRSCLVRSKGQPSGTKVGIGGTLGKSSPFQVHRSFAMLVSRLINHQDDSLADSRWSLARCDAGYSVIAVFGGWCDSVMRKRRSNEKLQVSRGELSSVTGLLSPNANVGNKGRSGSTKDIEVDTSLLEKGRDKIEAMD